MTAVGQYSEAGIIHMLITGQAKKKKSKGEGQVSAASESADMHVAQRTSGYLHKKGSEVLHARRIFSNPVLCLSLVGQYNHVRVARLANGVQKPIFVDESWWRAYDLVLCTCVAYRLTCAQIGFCCG